MTRAKCDNCQEVFSTTSAPNGKDGFFITDRAVEELECELQARQAYAFHLPEILELVAARGHRCPSCRHITVTQERLRREPYL